MASRFIFPLHFGSGSLCVIISLLSPIQAARCQTKLLASDAARLLRSDDALFSPNRERRDFGCRVTAVKPAMALDMRFHAGYSASVPLRQLSGPGGSLRIISRVVPLGVNGPAVALVDRVSVPAIEAKTGSEAEFSGEYVVGSGKYQVDWFIRDEAGRTCSSHWKIEAKLDGHFSRRAARDCSQYH